MPHDLTDAELDELGDLLAATPAPLEPLDVPMTDGYLAGVLVQPRLLVVDEWLPPLFDTERRALPPDADPVWLARVQSLAQRRHAALTAAISEDGFFDPVVVDIDDLPPASEYDPVQSPVSRALMPWAAGFEWAQACFGGLDGLDDAVDAALARIYRHLPPHDDADRARAAALDRERPLPDIEAGLQDLVEATVELWDLTSKARYAVPTIRRDGPKVGRNDPCPCGSGRKFKACHGR